MPSETFVARAGSIRLLALDVDGVLTDGRILLSGSGDEIKGFSSRDGIGFRCWHLAGHHSALITARASPAVTRRAGELGIRDVVLDSNDKRAALGELAESRGVALEEIAFMGDDLQDLAAMLAAGLAITVGDASEELLRRAHLVTAARGGEGAVREAIESLLRAQGRWQEVLARFLP